MKHIEIENKQIPERTIEKMALVYRLMGGAKSQDLKLFNKYRTLLKNLISETAEKHEIANAKVKMVVEKYAHLNLSSAFKPILGYVDGVARNDVWVDQDFNPRFDLLDV